MILVGYRIRNSIFGIPRASGGDPAPTQIQNAYIDVFPAQAGVILRCLKNWDKVDGIPRASGGDPHSMIVSISRPKYSPRKRG